MRRAGKFELAILQGGTHAVLAFLDFGFGQAHYRKIRQAIGDVHFNSDECSLHSRKCAAIENREAHVYEAALPC